MAENLKRNHEGVVNLPSTSMWPTVEQLAPLTGKNSVPAEKSGQFQFEKDKFAAAGLTPLASELVRPFRVQECPIQMEATVLSMNDLGGRRVSELGAGLAAVVEVLRVHADEAFVIDATDHVDPRQVIARSYQSVACWLP